MSEVRKRLIQAGIRCFKGYGYPDVDDKNIINNMIYSAFFSSMLNDNLGAAGPHVDTEIKVLLREISTQQEQSK